MSDVTSMELQFSRTFSSPNSPKSTDDRPLFLAADAIHGVVNVDYGATRPASARTDVIKLRVYGIFSFRVSRSGAPSWDNDREYPEVRKVILNMVDVLPLRPTPGIVARCLSVPFDLALPNNLPPVSDNNFESPILNDSRKQNHLPSSLSVGSIMTSSLISSGQRIGVTVSYTLQAYAMRSGKVLRSLSRDICIFDGAAPQPPICTSDFFTEYLCQQPRVLRKNLFIKTGNICAVMAEPKPFIFCRSKDSAWTTIMLTFVVERTNQKELDNDTSFSVDKLDATITWRLRASTFMSAEPMTSVPTVCQAHESASVGLITSPGLRRRLKLALRDWEKIRTRPMVDHRHGQAEVWTSRSELKLAIPKRVLPAPTFFTPHVSRRYSIQAQIQVTGTGRAHFHLEVPVQIVYLGVESTADRPSGGIADGISTEADLCSWQTLEMDTASELPIYVL